MDAWTEYRTTLAQVRADVLSQPWAADTNSRAQAENHLLQIEAAAYNMVIAPRPHYPELYVHTVFQPLVYNYSLHAADFLYRKCFLDGRCTYRIWGRRNSSLFVDFQVISVSYGLPNPRTVGNWDLDGFDLADDGSFEITLSAEPQPGNLIQLEPATGDRNVMNIREAFDDWEAQGADLHIEWVSGPRHSSELTTEALAERVERAGRFVRFQTQTWSTDLTRDILANAGTNTIYFDSFASNAGAANNPMATYPTAVWEIADDEALILECDVPQTGFWSVQLGDMWWQSLDYTYHQTSLNNRQARLDDDGRFRAVLTHDDPGAANWLDTLGHRSGVLIFRFFRADRTIRPTARLVRYGEIYDHLPASTSRVDAETRARDLVRRSRGSRQRYGH
jgi:hypothetical protein